MLGGHGRRKAAEGRPGRDTRPTAAGAGAGAGPGPPPPTWYPRQPSPCSPRAPPVKLQMQLRGRRGVDGGGACNTSFESSQEVCLSLMFALPNNIQLVVLGLFFNDFHCHDFLKGNFIETRGGMRATPAEAQSPGGFLQPRPHRHLLRTTREPLVAGRMRSSLLQLPVVHRCPRVQENGIVII